MVIDILFKKCYIINKQMKGSSETFRIRDGFEIVVRCREASVSNEKARLLLWQREDVMVRVFFILSDIGLLSHRSSPYI